MNYELTSNDPRTSNICRMLMRGESPGCEMFVDENFVRVFRLENLFEHYNFTSKKPSCIQKMSLL